MKPIKIDTPLTKEKLSALKVGDEVLLSGTIFTARDAAHKKLHEILVKGGKLPINLENAAIYYAGPAPAPAGRPIGSCGPTTSSRMDAFTPGLIKLGLKGMIGKGARSEEVRRAVMKHGCVYFIAIGGLGALLSLKVKSCRQILFKDLGPEAVHKLEVKDFPLIVGIDTKGKDIYEKTKQKSG
jgi:fumarate hydratase subunit beta